MVRAVLMGSRSRPAHVRHSVQILALTAAANGVQGRAPLVYLRPTVTVVGTLGNSHEIREAVLLLAPLLGVGKRRAIMRLATRLRCALVLLTAYEGADG